MTDMSCLNDSLNNSTPRVLAANLKNVQTKFPGMVEPWEVTTANNVKVAAVGVVCPSVAAVVRDPEGGRWSFARLDAQDEDFSGGGGDA